MVSLGPPRGAKPTGLESLKTRLGVAKDTPVETPPPPAEALNDMAQALAQDIIEAVAHYITGESNGKPISHSDTLSIPIEVMGHTALKRVDITVVIGAHAVSFQIGSHDYSDGK